MDPRIFGRLSELDVLVHRRDWKIGERVEARFQKLWEDAVREYEFPKSWRTDIKVKMLSDDDWAIRAPGYTLDVGKGAYIELGGNVARRVLRHLRANYGGFNIDYSAVAQPVAVLLCVGMLQQFGAKTENLTVSAALESERVVAILRENLEEDDAKEIHESLRDHLSDDVLAMTVREAASYSGMDFERSLSTSSPFLSSGVTTRASYRWRARRVRSEWLPAGCSPGWPWTGDSSIFGSRHRRTCGCGSIRRLSA